MNVRTIALVLLVLTGMSPPAMAAPPVDVSAEATSEAAAQADLPRLSITEITYRRRPTTVFPERLRTHMLATRTPSTQVEVSCLVDQRYDARGRLAEVVVTDCEGAPVEVIEPGLKRGLRGSRVVLPEGADEGAWVSARIRWMLR